MILNRSLILIFSFLIQAPVLASPQPINLQDYYDFKPSANTQKNRILNERNEISELILLYELQKIKIKNLEKEIGLLSPEKKAMGMTFSEWSGILLACVTVLVTILGVLIAVLSFWGYRSITKNAKTIAENISNNTASKVASERVESCINEIAKKELAELIKLGHLTEHLESAVDMIFRRQFSSNKNDGYGFGEYGEFDEEEDEKNG